MYLGSHISSSGKLTTILDRAQAIGAECVQVFVSNPKGWSFKIRDKKEISDFRERLKNSNIRAVFGHTIYLTNLASPNPYIYTNSLNSLISALAFARQAGLSGVITHVGSPGETDRKEGVRRVAEALTQALGVVSGVPILLETDAGSGNHLGNSFEELKEIIDLVGREEIGVCLDTCHIFAAGYDITSAKKIDKVLTDFDNTIGLSKLKALHLNDSKGKLASRVDRHEEIGKGEIGLEAFRTIVNHSKLKDLCGMVETPDNKDTEAAEKLSIDTLKELRKT